MASNLLFKFAIGDRWMACVNHYGPSSYAPLVPGATPTGGDALQASEFGLKFIDGIIEASNDATGAYYVEQINPGAPGVNTTPPSVTSAILQWGTAPNGIEVVVGTNLSAFATRVVVIGQGG